MREFTITVEVDFDSTDNGRTRRLVLEALRDAVNRSAASIWAAGKEDVRVFPFVMVTVSDNGRVVEQLSK